MENFNDLILQVLIAAAVLELIMGVWEHGWRQGWIEGFSIFMACVIIVVVTSGNNYVKEKQFQQLVAKASEDYVAVYRGTEGETQTIRVEKLVVGDIIKLETG